MTSVRGGSAAMVPAVGGEAAVPAPDAIASDYILLALRLDQHESGIVDGYFGPRDLKAQVDTEQLPTPARLADDARRLRERVARELGRGPRAEWLDRQLIALETLARRIAGEAIDYVDEVRRCFDAEPEETSPETYAHARATLDGIVPGTGSLGARIAEWDSRFVIPPDRVSTVVDWLMPRIRDAAAARFPIPDGEALRVSLVTNQPWGGYNWYDGSLRSRVDINTDLPIRAPALIGLLTHETYPGHHLEHAWKERRLVHEEQRLEASILLIDTPECYISEGLAELGGRLTVGDADRVDLLAAMFEVAGLAADRSDADRQLRIAAALDEIRGSRGDAALRLHRDRRPRAEVERFLVEEALMTPERAAKQVDFASHPLWRTYVFSYAGGERLLSRWTDAAGSEDAARGRFLRLLQEQLTPSGIARELAGAPRTGDALTGAQA